MGLLGMVLGSLRLPLSDGMRTDGDSALGQLCDCGRAGPTWRWMAAALLWGWLRRAMEGVPSSVVLLSKMAAASWPALCVGYWLRDV